MKKIEPCATISFQYFAENHDSHDDNQAAVDQVKAALEPSKKPRSSRSVTSAVLVNTVNKWKSDFKENGKYLELESESDTMKKIWCSVCRSFAKDKTAAFATGTSNLKKETIKKHFQSEQRADSLKIKIARQVY